MARILYVTPRFPWPLSSGQQIATFKDLQYLSQYAVIDMVSLIDPSEKLQLSQYISDLRHQLPNVTIHRPFIHPIHSNRSLVRKMLYFMLSLYHRQPYIVGKLHNSNFVRYIINFLSSNDIEILFIDQIGASYLVDLIPVQIKKQTKIVYRSHDILFETLFLYRKQLKINPILLPLQLDLINCIQYERHVWESVDYILPISRRMGGLIATISKSAAEKIIIFPTPIDPPPYTTMSAKRDARILYVGSVHYPPNFQGLQWFLRTCWPIIRKQLPQAQIDIVGRGSEHLPAYDGVNRYGYVDDVEPFYQKAAVLVVPLLSGSGVRIKILEAMSRGLPVVSTRVGYAGIDLIEGEHALVSDDPEVFSKYTCDILVDVNLQQNLSRKGREFIFDYYNKHKDQNLINKMLSK